MGEFLSVSAPGKRRREWQSFPWVSPDQPTSHAGLGLCHRPELSLHGGTRASPRPREYYPLQRSPTASRCRKNIRQSLCPDALAVLGYYSRLSRSQLQRGSGNHLWRIQLQSDRQAIRSCENLYSYWRAMLHGAVRGGLPKG